VKGEDYKCVARKKMWWKYKNNKPQSHKGSSSIIAWKQYIKRWTTSAWTLNQMHQGMTMWIEKT
jgi:hypothetical protein